MFKPFHLIGLELNISVLSAGLLGKPTGATRGFNGDVVATTKRDLAAGEVLDGEGGATVYGKLLPAQKSLSLGGLPIGLAHGVRLKRPVAAGTAVSWDDVEANLDDPTVIARRDMERRFLV
jgi:predicted homoserine dehydrogenase-like protein